MVENAERPSYQTIGAFRIQVGRDLCGLQQLGLGRGVPWEPARGEAASVVGGEGDAISQGRREGPPEQSLEARNMKREYLGSDSVPEVKGAFRH